MLKLLPRVTQPLVVTYGSEELPTSAAFRGLPDEIAKLPDGERRRLMLLAGADHFYSNRYGELWSHIELGLRRVLA